MSILYDGSHSVTFIKGAASSSYSVRRSWEDFHLVPEKPPVVMARTPKTVILDVPFSSNSIDYTNIVNKGTYFEPSSGEWSFYVDHDKWNSWHEAKEAIVSFINGQALYCVIEDDHDYKYYGRFGVSDWEDGSDYSKITISYNIDGYKLNNDYSYVLS